MLPESIPNYALGPFIGLVANGVMAVFCLISLAFYRTYRPLRSLFLFYFSLTFCFLGWVIFGLQKTLPSMLFGYRIEYAAMALLPTCWLWFVMSLSDERPGWFRWTVTGVSLLLAGLALFGGGPYLFSLPMKPDPVLSGILRPRSDLLRPVIQIFCVGLCLLYFLMLLRRLMRPKGRRPVYLICAAIGLLVWFLGGIHDAARAAGVILVVEEYVLWFASLWLSIFLAIAIALHFRSLEGAVREELERLNRVKGKALDHLAHELRTPLAVVKAKVRLLKRKLQAQDCSGTGENGFETLEKNLQRLLDIQQEAELILRSYQALDEGRPVKGPGLFPPGPAVSVTDIAVSSIIQDVLKEVKHRIKHRQIHFLVEIKKDLCVIAEPRVLHEVLEGLLKNAIENTPDEGAIQILLESANSRALLKVQDFGVGITPENQEHIFDGFFHTEETEAYSSRKPYDFNAGGKGLDLFRMKTYEQHFGFRLSVESKRCIHLPGDRDRCPGRISICPHCHRAEDCFASGGSAFSVSLSVAG